MPESSGKVAFTVRLPEDLHKALRVAVAERSTNLQAALEQAVSLWLKPGLDHPGWCPLAGAGDEELKSARRFLAVWRLGARVRALLAALLSALEEFSVSG